MFSQQECLCIWKKVWLQKSTHCGIETRTPLPLCEMPNKLCPILQFPSSVIATSVGLSHCILLGINLCQPPSRVTATRVKLRVWRPGPSSAEAFLALLWLENWAASPTCSTPRWMLWFTYNLLTVHHTGGRCTWHSDVIVPQCLAVVGFVSCEGDFSLPESCPTWLWVTHLCAEDQRASTGWLAKFMNKELSESDRRPTPELDKICITNDVVVPFELQAYWLII